MFNVIMFFFKDTHEEARTSLDFELISKPIPGKNVM